MKNTTFGSAWMHHWLVNSLRVLDVRLLYLFVFLFVMPICLLLNTNHSRTTAYHYFRCRLNYGRLRAAWATYVNHCLFGTAVIDRFAMFAGKHFEVKVEGYEKFQQLSEQQAGFMMLSSHIGCYEVAGYSLVSKDKRLNALVFGGEKVSVMQGRQEKFAHNNVRMIPVGADMSHLFLMNEALANKEILSVPADRVIGSPKTISVTLLGAKAQLPMGPFSVATMRGIRVVAVNVMKTSVKGYTVYVTPLKYDETKSRKEQMVQLAQDYADELECRVRQYPEQWYNFYEFWK